MLGLLAIVMTTMGLDTNDDFSEFDQEDDAYTEDVEDEQPMGGEEKPSQQQHEQQQQENEEDEDNFEDKGTTTERENLDQTSTDDVVEDDEGESDEFDPFSDEEEFEGYSRSSASAGAGNGGEKNSKKKMSADGLKITKVPAHLRAGWQSFYFELLTLVGIIVYATNFFAGKNKNSRLATSWFKHHKTLLEQQFAIVGDDGMSTEPSSGVLVKESESVYTLWCTGRQCCEGMLVELKLLKRHDLVSVMSQMMRPISDMVRITIYMDDEDMDNFVFALLPKKTAAKCQKDLQDLSYFCGDKKSAERYGLDNHSILTECGEVADFVLNTQICNTLKKYENCFESLHFSDQFVGPKKEDTEEDANAKLKKPKKVLMFEFKIPGTGRTRVQDMGCTEGLVRMIIFLIERMKTFRLSQQARLKSDKKRREVEETHLKQLHAQRQEASQLKREEKARAEKDKLMAETDPDKQRKMEDAMSKRDAKKRGPKVKSMKVRM